MTKCYRATLEAIPIFIYLLVRVGFASSAPDMINERARPVCAGTGRRRISGIRFFPEHMCQLLAPKVIHVEASCNSIGKSLGGLLMGSWESIWKTWSSPGSLLEVSWTKSPGNLDGSLCWPAVSMDEPEVRRVGFASFALLPPSRARAPLLRLGEAELWFGRGALRNARGTEIRTYGSSVCF